MKTTDPTMLSALLLLIALSFCPSDLATCHASQEAVECHALLIEGETKEVCAIASNTKQRSNSLHHKTKANKSVERVVSHRFIQQQSSQPSQGEPTDEIVFQNYQWNDDDGNGYVVCGVVDY